MVYVFVCCLYIIVFCKFMVMSIRFWNILLKDFYIYIDAQDIL